MALGWRDIPGRETVCLQRLRGAVDSMAPRLQIILHHESTRTEREMLGCFKIISVYIGKYVPNIIHEER